MACPSSHASRDGKRTVPCMHRDKDHQAAHEGIDYLPSGGVDVLRWDRFTGELAPPTREPR